MGQLVQLGHDVKMGSRTANNEKAAQLISQWSKGISGEVCRCGVVWGDCVQLHCWDGFTGSAKACQREEPQGRDSGRHFQPPRFLKRYAPTLSVCNTDSLAEPIQRAFPEIKVVKTLNTLSHTLMVNPALVHGDHDVFLSGNDAAAKAKVAEILRSWFGWKSVVDMGDITTARGTEMLLPIWVRLYGLFQNPNFNFKIVR